VQLVQFRNRTTDIGRGNVHVVRHARIPGTRGHQEHRYVPPGSHAPGSANLAGHGTAVDWWAFGILVYEFLVGQPPFWDQNPMKIYEQCVPPLSLPLSPIDYPRLTLLWQNRRRSPPLPLRHVYGGPRPDLRPLHRRHLKAPWQHLRRRQHRQVAHLVQRHRLGRAVPPQDPGPYSAASARAG
jgi:serine/threonine protein kinase